jgi:hypothetical protein
MKFTGADAGIQVGQDQKNSKASGEDKIIQRCFMGKFKKHDLKGEKRLRKIESYH